MQSVIKVCLLILGLWTFPSLAEERPEAFLSRLITSDFNGDCDPRFDKIYYTTELEIENSCECSGLRREVYHPHFNSLFIITNWQIVKTKMESKSKALVTVRYRVIAKAERISVERENDVRQITPYDPPRDEELTYQVWRCKGQWKWVDREEMPCDGQWMWVDPPEMPRVGYEAVRKAVEGKYRRLEDDLLKEEPENTFWQKIRDIYKAELSALEALRPIIKADAKR
jgi:hypothetical protein